VTRENDFHSHAEIEAFQLEALRSLLGHLRGRNPFYSERLRAAGVDGKLGSLQEYRAKVPFTHKAELIQDQQDHPPYGSNLTRPLEEYIRLHQTSGTTATPMQWLDSRPGWRWVVDAWRTVLEVAGVTPTDRVFVAFSFGPFIGLWLAFEAAHDLGALALCGAALDTEARLRSILHHRATVLCCTPTYALRLCEAAREYGIDLAASSVTKLIVAGEPGGCLEPVRRRLEASFPGARVFDHYGLTEMGPVTYQCVEDPSSVHVAESFHLPEVIDPRTARAIEFDGRNEGELVLTNLGRTDSPLLRYRTGDLVRPRESRCCACGRPSLRLLGGILARTDDMIVVRGVNLFPSAVDALVRGHAQVAEYTCEIRTERGMSELEIRVEARPGESAEAREELVGAIENDFRQTYHLRVPVHLAEPATLPRFELKARRWIRT
jgi:phenylacetate-CoA ligase